MLNFDKTLIIPEFDLIINNLSKSSINNDETKGAIGGTAERKRFYISPEPSVTALFQLLNGRFAVGGKISGDYSFEESIDIYEDFNRIPESQTYESRGSTYKFDSEIYAAIEIGNIDLGLIGGMGYGRFPPERYFVMITDTSVSSVPYTEDESHYEWEIINPRVSLGVSFPAGPGKLGMAGHYVYYSIFSRDLWISEDKDGDGYFETITSQEPTEPGEGEYSYQLTLSSDYVLPISNSTDFFLTADWNLLDYETTNRLNGYVYNLDKGLKNINAIIGFSSIIGTKLEFKMAGGYAYENSRKTEEYIDAIFTEANENHFHEEYWTEQPDNETIRKSSFIPEYEVEHTFKFISGIKWNPTNNISFFSNLIASYSGQLKTWKVFNTFDNTVWTEVEENREFDLNLDALFGVAVRTGDSMIISFTGSLGSISDIFNSSADMLPTSDAGQINTTTNDLEDENRFNMDLSCVLSF